MGNIKYFQRDHFCRKLSKNVQRRLSFACGTWISTIVYRRNKSFHSFNIITLSKWISTAVISCIPFIDLKKELLLIYKMIITYFIYIIYIITLAIATDSTEPISQTKTNLFVETLIVIDATTYKYKNLHKKLNQNFLAQS